MSTMTVGTFVALLWLTGPLAAQTRLPMPPPGVPTVVPAGPAWLTVGSNYPTNFVVKWTAVSGASSYRIWRWSDEQGSTRWLRGEVNAASVANPAESGYAIFADHSATKVGPAYSYQVEAVSYTARGAATVSTPSPIGTARSVPYLAPGNLRYTTLPPVTKSEVHLLLTFDQVPGTHAFYFTGTVQQKGSTLTLSPSSVGTGPILFDASPGASAPPNNGTLLPIPLFLNRTYVFCLSSIYYEGISDRTVKNCLTVPL